MPDILDFYAQTHTPYLHARGRRGTGLLLNEIGEVPGEKILELGFGTGQTLVDVAGRRPECELFGVEKSEMMMQVAAKRLRFCRLNRINLFMANSDGALPFPDDTFDVVYAESVLAYLPEAEIRAVFFEVYRVLKNRGVFLLNESLWRKHVSPETMDTINRECVRLFGMPQAVEQIPYPEDWVSLAGQTGFRHEKLVHLTELPEKPNFPAFPGSFCSGLFTLGGRIKKNLSHALRLLSTQYRESERSFSRFGLFLEGVFFKFSKPDDY